MKRITRLVIEIESEPSSTSTIRSTLVQLFTAAIVNVQSRVARVAPGTTVRWYLESVEDRVELERPTGSVERIESVRKVATR